LVRVADALLWGVADGSIINTNNLWVITVDSEGRVGREDWKDVYDKIRKALGAERPVGAVPRG
jgi:hypothetical protein